MDGSQFDDLTRFMAERPSRRKVLAAMAAAISGSLASVGTALGAPRCKRIAQACQTTADCCPGPTANGNVYCKQVSKKSKVCAGCPSETPTACNGGCINTNNDNLNCGACGTVCHGGTTCVNGSCQCPAGKHLCADNSCQECCALEHCVDLLGQGVGAICCDGTCLATRFDETNCGACGNACSADQLCLDGNCTCTEEGKHVGPDGQCTCVGTSCAGNFPCCDGWYCDDSTSICTECRPAGAAAPIPGSSKGCCSDAAFDGICVNQCASGNDCQADTGQVCDEGICICPTGTQISAGGLCV
jgi:hypothetical protein